jgi:hypothetical protein
MVSLMSLAVPIVVSAVLVFIVSSIVHMALPYHKNDFSKLPNEDEVLEAFRRTNVAPGDYTAPHATAETMKDPAFQEKMKRGPALVMTVWNGDMNMGALLGQWFLFALLVSFFTAYVLSRVFAPGADYMTVFRIGGTVAFMGYALGGMPAAIWYKKSWATTLRSTFDGLLYGLVTAGAFGWLWP